MRWKQKFDFIGFQKNIKTDLNTKNLHTAVIKIEFMITQNKRLIGIVLIVGLLLLIPFIAMQFTNEVKWDSRDFVIMGVLLLGTGLMCEFVMRKVKKTQHRVLLIAAILLALFLIWAELAVGIFGTPFAGS